MLNGPIAPVLRPYQLAAIAGVRAEFARGHRRTLLVLATGTGKTVCFAELVRAVVESGSRALVLAHRTELLKQAQRKLLDVGVASAIEKAERRAGNAPCIVASVQTLKGARLERLRQEDFGLLVVDEAHHSMATSYRGILEHFGATPTLGVTATADRADGKALGELYETVAYRYDLRQAIREKFLAPIRARRVVVQGLDLSSVRTRAGDLAQDDLAAIMNAEQVMHGIVGPLLEQAGQRKTMVFCVDVAGAHALAAMINRYRPSSARAIDGSAEEWEREKLLEDYRSDAFQFLVNCALFTEGFDEPSVACVATCRPTKSRALYTQMVGRGTRLFPGKDAMLLLDFVGNSGRHKLIGPIDALAPGAVADDLYGEANELLTGDEGDVDAALAEAELVLERKREAAAATARARYFAEDVDPFLGGETLPDVPRFPGFDDAAVEAQVKELLERGIKHVPADLTRGDAARIIEAIRARSRAGLSSVKQNDVLRKFGVNVRKLTSTDAGTLMGTLNSSGFSRRALDAEMRRLESIKPRSWQ